MRTIGQTRCPAWQILYSTLTRPLDLYSSTTVIKLGDKGELMEIKLHHTRTSETKHISLRIPIDAANALESDSARLGISVNSLASSILRRWARWDRHMPSLGMILISKDLLSLMLRNNNEMEVTSFVDRVLPIYQDAVMLVKGEYHLKSSIDLLEDYMQYMNIPASHTIEGSMHHFVIHHKMGVMWSIFIKMLLAHVFATFVPEKNIEYDIGENLISIKAPLGSDWDEHDY